MSSQSSQSNELLSLEWPEQGADGTGHGHVLEIFFKFCDEHSISIGAQIIILSLFEAAGVDLSVDISERQFGRAMEKMKERTSGKIKFEFIEGTSDQ